MQITDDTLRSNLLYSEPFHYTDKNNTFDLVLYPVTMEYILDFSMCKQSILVRKNSTFPVKKVIKMTYLDFLFFTYGNTEFAQQYNMPLLPIYYLLAYKLLKMVFKDQEVEAKANEGGFRINGVDINATQFDDIRRIIILQNGIDFDIDEFIHYDTEQELLKAQKATNGNKNDSTIEDYIDSVCVAINKTEQEVKEMTVRKFWRYIKRISKKDAYMAMKSAESTGMVKFKEPIQYWMSSIEEKDQFEKVKTDTQTLKQMIG